MQDTVLSSNSAGGVPPLTDGQASEASHHGLVVHADITGHGVWVDLAIALVVAIAAPLLLKKLLETEFAARLFRTPPPNPKAPSAAPTTEEEFDFDT